ncbi:hypothetical protein [Nocardioides currus]|uniref:Uncharacterized protein n=1 Tax=Nocardioides currus TaxID=2133958 RepID=A0A2R7YSZ3_9ACTN|nr:hypothetical protein [Nocardioides currus]PUA79423.1 hypothetical protein C7S10_18775 [Nocardioides currus]
MTGTTPTPGRDGHAPSRPAGHPRRRRAALVVALGSAAALIGVAALAAGPDGQAGAHRSRDDLRLDWEARSSGVQVLGGDREPGTPSVQRIRHDGVSFTVTVAPARPGPNLVRIDAARIRDGELVAHGSHRGKRAHTAWVGTNADFEAGDQVRAEARPGADGLWAVVDLPAGTATVLVSHGARHRVPFAVDTGSESGGTETWTGPDGPECLTAATSSVLAGGAPPAACPADALDDADAAALTATVRALGERGVRELAVQRDDSARSRAAHDLVRRVAATYDLRLVPATAPPGPRNALLVLSGWQDAATSLTRVTALPLRQQPIRSDGTWLAPWLLSPGVVDSTAGAVLPLDFDIRDARAQEFSQTLAALFPGQSPTSSGYVAWRAARDQQPDDVRLYAASRAAYMPAEPGHGSHGSEVAWFPGGTVTAVAALTG